LGDLNTINKQNKTKKSNKQSSSIDRFYKWKQKFMATLNKGYKKTPNDVGPMWCLTM
jgi:hypothetical protein